MSSGVDGVFVGGNVSGLVMEDCHIDVSGRPFVVGQGATLTDSRISRTFMRGGLGVPKDRLSQIRKFAHVPDGVTDDELLEAVRQLFAAPASDRSRVVQKLVRVFGVAADATAIYDFIAGVFR